MGKPKNESILDKLHNIERYRAQVDAIYRELEKEAAAIAAGTDSEMPDVAFSPANYPKTTKLIDALITTYKTDVENGVSNIITSKKTTDRPTPNNNVVEQIFEDRGIVKIDIGGFIKKYMTNIPTELFIELRNLRYRKGCTSTEIPLAIYEDIKNRKLKRDRLNERIEQTAKANNDAIALEKNGDIEKAIELYEWNIYENHCEATLSFDRLIILYGKMKDDANKRRILEKGIEVFENLYPNIAEKYRSKLSELVSPKTKIYPLKAEPHTHLGFSLQEQFEKEQWKLPEFDFCPGLEKYGYSGPKATKTMFEIRTQYGAMVAEAENNENIGRYDLAAKIYEILVNEGYPFPLPYEKLVSIYTKSKLIDDIKRILTIGIAYFSSRKSKQFEYVDSLAKKYNAVDFWQSRKDKGEKIMYYFGIFELYNPYPCIEKFKSKLEKLNQKVK